MRLTWKDAAATAIVVAGGALYAWHLAAPDTAFVGSTRWLAGVVFLVGVGACAVGGSYDTVGRYTTGMSALAAVALLLSLTGLISGWELALGGLVGLIGAMWLVTTVRHALGRYPPKAPPRPLDGSHEELLVELHRK